MHLEDLASSLGVEGFELAAELALRDGDFAGEIQHLVEFFDVNPQSAVPGGPVCRRRNRCVGRSRCLCRSL